MILLILPTYSIDKHQCFHLHNLFNQVQKIGGKKWDAFQLKRNNQAWHILLVQDGEPSINKMWLLFSRDSMERPEIYCLSGQGNTIEQLSSIHSNKFDVDGRYGMPGSGHPRCASSKDFWDRIKIRSWANKELGDSLVFSLNKDIHTHTSFTMLLSKKDAYWILLDEDNSNPTCYFDRGEGWDLRKIVVKETSADAQSQKFFNK
jgi:hypothetical protein